MKKDLKNKRLNENMKIYWDKNYLAEQLERGNNYLDIAKENNVGKSTIQRALNHHGLTKANVKWTANEICLLKKYYGKTTNLTTIFSDRTESSIYHKANKLGLESGLRNRTYHVDENFFKKWTKEMAYVLGWMFSDGNMAPDDRMFRIKLSNNDIKILEKIKETIKTDSPIRVINQQVLSKEYTAKYAILNISNKKMCQDLNRLGCVRRKTHKFKIPNIPRKLLKHFIRGYFDGDGSITFNKPNTIKIRIVGANKQFIWSLAQIFKNEFDIPINHKRIRNIWQCEYYGDNARKICEWMYKDCGDLYLERKRTRFEEHLKKRGTYV